MGLFFQGKIYATTYTNWKHDSKPLLFILYSDANKTHAINLHYLPQPLLIQFIEFVKKFNQQFPLLQQKTANLGKILYEKVLKRYYPQWIKYAYRTYKTPLLNGYLINEGITKPVATVMPKYPEKDIYKRDQIAKIINEQLSKSRVASIIPPEPTIKFATTQPKEIVSYKTEVKPPIGSEGGK